MKHIFVRQLMHSCRSNCTLILTLLNVISRKMSRDSRILIAYFGGAAFLEVVYVCFDAYSGCGGEGVAFFTQDMGGRGRHSICTLLCGRKRRRQERDVVKTRPPIPERLDLDFFSFELYICSWRPLGKNILFSLLILCDLGRFYIPDE